MSNSDPFPHPAVTLFFHQIQNLGAALCPIYKDRTRARNHKVNHSAEFVARVIVFGIMSTSATTGRASPEEVVPAGRRGKGMPNFRAEEDLRIAAAYVAVTVDAAVGTDQNGANFWGKVRDIFVEKGGTAGRTAVSMQNRFNRYLQADDNRYIGFVQCTMREHHSGHQKVLFVN